MTNLFYKSISKAPTITVTKGSLLDKSNDKSCTFELTVWNAKEEQCWGFVSICVEYISDKYAEILMWCAHIKLFKNLQ